MVIEKSVPGVVLSQWLKILRGRPWPGPTFPHRAYNVITERNLITTRALERPAADWQAFYFHDSDMVPDARIVSRLLELCRHPSFLAKDGGVIVGSYYARTPPFEVQIFDPHPELEGMQYLSPARWQPAIAEAKANYLKDRPGRLIKVGGGGTGSMLIRRDVLERMVERKGRGKVFELHPLGAELLEELRRKGEDRPGGTWTEDIWFCVEVRRLLGVQVLADTDLRLCSGHVETEHIVTPDHYLAAHIAASDRFVLDTAKLERQGYTATAPAPVKP
jgi:hypothetical protein